ncbi:myoD family inhibitor domain-containing protein 2-like [Notolabrus celidotus]|uniref:myoD family inhibitor domain-containing protein 2-like n=1 Tax=Notolabrus celidotus TaxID=1203425 RepID=UPI0014901106|nr:myoD family inhibitor domain-containing protein 2-like [Notolabrus celidotus]
MTSQVNPPVDDEDCIELEKVEDHVSDENTTKPGMGGPSRKMRAKSVSGNRRLSTISEREPEKLDTDPGSQDPLGASEWGGSSFSTSSDKFKNSSSHFSSAESYQPDTADDCAALLLACLHCRFHELIMVLIPDTCERAVSRCFPSYKYIKASSERDQQESDCCNCKLDLDCNFCGCCQDTAELIELAMEISEVCYR